MNLEEILRQADEFFEKNQPKEAEKLLLSSLRQAEEAGEAAVCLNLLNELIGYYRQTSEKEALVSAIENALLLVEKMELTGSIPHATTAVNAANGYRSIGDYENSYHYYKIAEKIYLESLPKDDLRLAGFYNNYSLLCQERGQFAEAEEALCKALEIVKKQNAGFEIAVTYANLANTCVQGENLDRTRTYAKEAIRIFQERNCLDAHYAAALSALGTCAFLEKDYETAEKYFAEGMEAVETTIGRNSQYERLAANRDACLEKILEKGEVSAQGQEDARGEAGNPTSGRELSRAYYEQFGKPMIREKFPEYEDKIAVGLVGKGSDCFGYDDALSRDHDWGPGFCLWLTDETYEKIGEALKREYAALPKEFQGFSVRETQQGKDRRGVFRISEFYQTLLGTDDPDGIDYARCPDHALAEAVNGEVFCDREGVFSAIRKKLKQGYPERIRLLKLAEDVVKVAQNGTYNYLRVRRRGDLLTAQLCLAEALKDAMRLYHHLYNVYPPHDKWLRRSVQGLPEGETLDGILVRIWSVCVLEADDQRAGEGKQTGSGADTKRFAEALEALGEFLARKMYESGEISDIDPYLAAHSEELVYKAGLAGLTDAELVERIARTEFQAFDVVKNEGGRASCQNDWPTFSVMRKSQYMTWTRPMLVQYLYDFEREFACGHNLITEKYGRMMESTAPERYAEIKENFPELSEQKKAVIESVVSIQMEMADAFALEYPDVMENARSLHTYEDNFANTSYETYLRGEISTYSDKMLQLYAGLVIDCAAGGVNIARKTIENTAKLYGFDSLEDLTSKDKTDKIRNDVF